MKRKTAEDIARDVATRVLTQWEIANREYSNPSFSTLEIHFAEGSDVPTLSIPYQRFANRESVSIPYRLVKP